MTKTIFIIFGALILFKASLFANASEKVLVREIAVYSMSGKVYFLKELRREVASLKRFDCLFPDSLLLTGAELSSNELHGIKLSYLQVKKRDHHLRLSVEKLIKVNKTIKFINDQASIDYDDYWRTVGKQRCIISGPSGWSSALKGMVLAEHFLRERFEKRPANQLKESTVKFVDAVSKKIPHDVFL